MHDESKTQLTVRACIMGMLLGGLMSLSNLYVVLKTGTSFGMGLTAGVLAWVIFAAMLRVGIVRRAFGILENNAMQSVASAAGYMTGGGTAAAIPALMMITGEPMPASTMFPWIASIALLGVVMAIPMKQQMIDVEQLPFPSGIAAAETLKALHAAEGESGSENARMLLGSAVLGMYLTWFRDVTFPWFAKPFVPERLYAPSSVTLAGRPLWDFNIAFDVSTLMIASGAIMGFRAAWSMMLGATVNYVILAPRLFEAGIIVANSKGDVGYKQVVAWSVWFGSAMVLTSGLTAFAFQWRTVVRAVQSVANAFRGSTATPDGEVPMIWFVIGVALIAPVVIALEWFFFGIKPWLGVISVILSFFIAIVATRATGETDNTPSGALGKITQITFGALDPGNVTTNLMTANVTGGVGLHASDLLVDLKAGWVLKADPRQQFFAQFFGVLAGSAFVVPAYRILIPTADVLGTDKWPAPAAQTWKGVALMLSEGFHTLHPTAQAAMAVGGVLGILFIVLEKMFPDHKAFIPSPAGLGLAFTMPFGNSLGSFIGAVIALVLNRRNKEFADKSLIPISSGLIAGESLMGIVVAVLSVIGLLAG